MVFFDVLGFIAQTATYVSAVNHTLKGEGDTQTIGILICKTKDNILAKYAVETSTEPIGISEYELNALMPRDFQSPDRRCILLRIIQAELLLPEADLGRSGKWSGKRVNLLIAFQ